MSDNHSLVVLSSIYLPIVSNPGWGPSH